MRLTIAFLLLLAPCITAALPAGVMTTVQSIAELKALNGLTDGQVVSVACYYSCSSPDGGGGLMMWVAGNADVADDGVTFASNVGSAGRWKRVDLGQLTTKSFGAKGDGDTNDTSRLQAYINWLMTRSLGSGAVGGEFVVAPGEYLHNALTFVPVSGSIYINVRCQGSAKVCRFGYEGAGGDAITIKNVAYAKFANIYQVNQGGGARALVVQSLAAGSSTSNLHFENWIAEHFTDRAIRIGNALDHAASEINFVRSNVIGGRGIMSIEGLNSLNVSFQESGGYDFTDSIFYVDSANSNLRLTVKGASIGHNTGSAGLPVFEFVSPGKYTLKDIYVEATNKRFIRSGPLPMSTATIVPTSVTMENCIFADPSPSRSQLYQQGRYVITGGRIDGGLELGGRGFGDKGTLVLLAPVIGDVEPESYAAGADVFWNVYRLGVGTDDGNNNSVVDDGHFIYNRSGARVWVEKVAWTSVDTKDHGQQVEIFNIANADYTLSSEEASAQLLNPFSYPEMTAERSVYLPETRRIYFVRNNDPRFGVRFRLASHPGVLVGPGKGATIYCDGTAVIRISPDT